jgi:hypothetical protein
MTDEAKVAEQVAAAMAAVDDDILSSLAGPYRVMLRDEVATALEPLIRRLMSLEAALK